MPDIYNFGAGPGMLPKEVLLKAQQEMLNWRDTGVSVMELGHRGKEFQGLAKEIEANLREIMNIPENYQVLFLPGGATAQFSMVPMNLMAKNKKADYVDTGLWSKKAIAEAKRFGEVTIASATEFENNLAMVQPLEEWTLNPDAAYLHYTPNETIAGLEFDWVPKNGDVPVVADMTSMILSKPVDVEQFGIIYASAQKNLGQAGITIVIIRDDLITDCVANTPSTYNYKIMAENHSFYNTPPTYSWYITGLMLDWIKERGGVDAIYKRNQQKANILYNIIDKHSDFYICKVAPEYRSQMNVAFFLNSEELMEKFLAEADAQGMKYLKGHRSAGGIRASLYNPMPVAGCQRLAEFMLDFMKRNG